MKLLICRKVYIDFDFLFRGPASCIVNLYIHGYLGMKRFVSSVLVTGAVV